MLDDGQILEQVRFVGHECQAPLRFDRFRGEVVAVDLHVTGGGLQNAGQRPKRRRFACAVRSNQADDFSSPDGEREVVDGREVAVSPAEMLER
jgi:hypothetical protein